MTKIKSYPKLKRNLVIAILITIYAFVYSMIFAVLFAASPDTIYYHFSSGLSLSIIGCITIFIVYKVDSFINKMMIRSSRSILLINILLSFLASTFLFAVVGWILNVLLRGVWILNYSYLKEQLALINFLLMLILSFHTISYFTRSTALLNKKLRADNLEMSLVLNKYLTRIPSSLNKKTILIPVADIAYFQIEEGVIFANTIDGKKHALTITTLSELEAGLHPAVFFRINRSQIVNIDKIRSFEPYFKDRLAIKLSDNMTTLYTSNTKSAPFREWLTSPANYSLT